MIHVGVTQRQIVLNSIDTYDALEMILFAYFIKLNISLVPIPNYFGLSKPEVEFESWLKNNNIKGFLMSGGGDPFTVDNRYNIEDKVLEIAKAEILPVFAICRGLERIILHEGGSLVKCQNHINKIVNVSGEIEGNFQCFHELTISELPEQFRVTSLSKDNLIESVAHNTLPWEGCMWHPERSLERNFDFERRLSKLFNE